MLIVFTIGIVLLWRSVAADETHEGDGPEFFTLLIGFTPIVVPSVRAWVRSDPLQNADAAVVLSSSIRESGEMDGEDEEEKE